MADKKKPAAKPDDDPKAKADPKDEPKPEAKPDESPVTVSDTGRSSDAPSEDGAPMMYDEHGDAHAMPTDPETGYAVDPLLAPESQQAGESAEHYAERRAQMPKQS